MNMKRYDWTWDGMGENSDGGWVRYDDAQNDIAEAERRGAMEARRAMVWWLHGRGYGKSSAALKQALDGGEFDELRRPEPTPPPPTTVLDIVEASLKAGGYDGLFNAVGDCGCRLGDLSPGCYMSKECVAARNDPKQAKAEGTDFWMVPARVKT